MNKMRALREAAGISRKELAGKLGTSLPTISRWEADLFLPRDTKTLLVIAKLFHCTVDDLLKEEGE